MARATPAQVFPPSAFQSERPTVQGRGRVLAHPAHRAAEQPIAAIAQFVQTMGRRRVSDSATGLDPVLR